MSAHLPPLGEDLVRKLDVPGPRYTSYPTVPEWGRMNGGAAAAVLAATGSRPDPVSVYVHIPFCQEMCTYCGCHVIISRDPKKRDRYLELLRREAQLVRAALGGRHPVSRIHIGGGTPTSLDEAQLAELCSILEDEFTILGDAELAIEIDPVVTTRAQLEVLAGRGFRRISMGVQDLDPDVQEAVKRVQSEEVTRTAIADARALGFRSVNLDLIYGLPRQTPASWARTIERVQALEPDRISLFSFAYVPAVKPHQRRLQMADLPSGMGKLELFRIAHDALVDADFRAIGMDHFARPGDELAVAQEQGTLWRDFQGYSAGRGGAGTVALGVSSISDVSGAYYQNVKTLPSYAAALERGELPVERGLVLTADDERRRQIIGEVMCRLAVTLTPGEAEEFGPRLMGLQREGLCVLDGAKLIVTPLGRVFVRNVAMVFDAYLEREHQKRPTFSRTV